MTVWNRKKGEFGEKKSHRHTWGYYTIRKYMKHPGIRMLLWSDEIFGSVLSIISNLWPRRCALHDFEKPKIRAFYCLSLQPWVDQPPGYGAADGCVYHMSVKNKKCILIGSMSQNNCLMHCRLISLCIWYLFLRGIF